MKNFNVLLPKFILFSLCFFILMVLGTWQFNKNYLKKNNKTNFSNNLEQEPTNINSLNIKLNEFQFIRIKGSFLNKHTIFFEPRTKKGVVGFHKLVPFKVADKVIMVNRGFTENKAEENSQKEISIKGIIIKFPKPSYFELENDLNHNKWYTLEKNDISKYTGLKLENYLMYEIFDDNNFRKAVLPNTISDVNHLQYALTWFLLALTMSIVFFMKIYKKNND